ncbi:diacylglycerol O-acyltransferase 2 [Sphaerodactylus townsendi]|uniref:diacylglycerol O-acyltransferase 2 n=1 Tax=Sphaerodactylus townsendi TaxID=933632 RepID=UPI0020261EEE|nr:diacylglycerol O-acyltransferase 2 [Sphaerodactylus townsendi]
MKTIIAAYSGALRARRSSVLSALQDLSWLSKSKVEKQLQIISVFQWVLSFMVMGKLKYEAAFSLILLSPLSGSGQCNQKPGDSLPPLRAWQPLSGHCPRGRRSQWVRNWAMWRYYRDYFPIREFVSKGIFLFQEYLPDGLPSTSVAPPETFHLLRIPSALPNMLMLKTAGLGANGQQRSRRGIRNSRLFLVLRSTEPNISSRATKCNPTLLNSSCHADLVPVYSFGENEIYKQVVFEEGSWGRWAQKKFQKYIGFAPCLFHGRAVFSSNTWGFLPYSKPINTVVGEPITIPKIENPSQKEIDFYHSLYVSSLRKLFDKHKTKFGLLETDVLEVN